MGRNIEQGKVRASRGKFDEQREEMVKPRIFVFLFEMIFEGRPQMAWLGLFSGLLGIYLRFYHLSLTVLRLMQ